MCLGSFLRDARKQMPGEETRGSLSVEQVATFLNVTPAFVYLVEQGRRRPGDGSMGMWASIYGVDPVDLWKCLGMIPMNLVASYRREPEPTSRPIPLDPLSELTEAEKRELLPFVHYVRTKMGHRDSLTE